MASIKTYKTYALVEGQNVIIHTGLEFEYGGQKYHVRGGMAKITDNFLGSTDTTDYEIWNGNVLNDDSPDRTSIDAFLSTYISGGFHA